MQINAELTVDVVARNDGTTFVPKAYMPINDVYLLIIKKISEQNSLTKKEPKKFYNFLFEVSQEFSFVACERTDYVFFESEQDAVLFKLMFS